MDSGNGIGVYLRLVSEWIGWLARKIDGDEPQKDQREFCVAGFGHGRVLFYWEGGAELVDEFRQEALCCGEAVGFLGRGKGMAGKQCVNIEYIYCGPSI